MLFMLQKIIIFGNKIIILFDNRNAAKALEEESGILLEQPIVTKLKEAIMQGKWDSVNFLKTTSNPLIKDIKIEIWRI